MERLKEMLKNKQLVIGVAVIFLGCVIGAELPYSDKSIVQVLIPTIHLGNGTLYLSGFLVLGLWIYGFNKIGYCGRYSSRLRVFLVLVFIVGPLMNASVERIMALPYFFEEGVRSVDIMESKLHIYSSNDELNVEVKATYKCYRNSNEGLDIVLAFPEDIAQLIDVNEVVVESTKHMDTYREYSVDYLGVLNYREGYDDADLFELRLYDEDYILRLESDGEVVEIKMNDSI